MGLGKWFNRLRYLIAEADSSSAKVTDDSLLARIMAIDGTASDFDDNLHSLEALYTYMVNNLTDFGGLIYKGAVTTATSVTAFSVSQLIGYGTGAFVPNSGAAYEIYVFQADGAAPEGEQTPATGYTTTTGAFTHTAFSSQLAVGDVVYLIHPLLASLGTKATAAATGAPTTTDFLTAYVKQLVNNTYKLAEAADGTDPRPASVAADSLFAKLMGIGNPAAITTYDNTTDSLEAQRANFDAVIGAINTATAVGEITATDLVMAYVKQLVVKSRKQSVVVPGAVASVSSNTFVVSDFIGYGNDYFRGWWVHVLWDSAGSSAAPQDEWRQCSDFATSTGTVTHAAFSSALGATDVIEMVNPSQAQIMHIQGGAVTIKDIEDNQAAMLDYAKNVDTSTMTGAGTEDSIYDKTSTTPFHVNGIWLGLENMAAGDVIRFRGYMDFDDASIADTFTLDEVWTLGGAQLKKWVYMPLNMLVTYELKFTAEQLDGTNRVIYTVVDDGARGS